MSHKPIYSWKEATLSIGEVPIGGCILKADYSKFEPKEPLHKPFTEPLSISFTLEHPSVIMQEIFQNSIELQTANRMANRLNEIMKEYRSHPVRRRRRELEREWAVKWPKFQRFCNDNAITIKTD